ncbi:MAG TPA: MAPEG family protein [Accumulibacter sp.]|nr:MAPEG family protein [Accumulibacter sp.]HMW17775.1 MAPEG family protein [Accumulibacter sp.]HMX22281.1 MAPEG family protein [Accumulibacter sp.]HMY05636.1 MAPEG family protein [Accumulibacter sp.]HNC17893.1 MAPEG family protein [Accumulibacter sp.]
MGESPNVPEAVSLPNRNYMNLLELPLLFYVICVIAYTAQTSSVLLLPLAWSYVSLRLVHSIIHIAYNDVFHRFLAFALSNGVLIALWFVVDGSLQQNKCRLTTR